MSRHCRERLPEGLKHNKLRDQHYLMVYAGSFSGDQKEEAIREALRVQALISHGSFRGPAKFFRPEKPKCDDEEAAESSGKRSKHQGSKTAKKRRVCKSPPLKPGPDSSGDDSSTASEDETPVKHSKKKGKAEKSLFDLGDDLPAPAFEL